MKFALNFLDRAGTSKPKINAAMRITATIVFILLAASQLPAKVFDRTAEIAGVTLHYKVALPKDYDPARSYPAVLAFPPGSQDMQMVLTTLVQNWLPEQEKRGYIVVVPAAPYNQPFVGEGAKVFPEFIERLLHDYKIRDNKFHVAGMSNGGRSAFHIAAMYPQYFLSVTGFPGYLPNPTPERVAALAKMCIYMHVGELDIQWRDEMQRQASMFRTKGYSVRFTIENGEGHVMRTLAGPASARLFMEIEDARKGCP